MKLENNQPKQCSFIRANGSQCRAFAMTRSQFCFSHDPKMKEVKKEAVKRGGLARRNRLNLLPVKIKTMWDVIVLLEDTVNRLRSGEIEPRTANTIGFLSGHMIRSLEKSDLEKRLEELEKAVLK